MAKFTYRFESVRRVKEIVERQIQKELQVIELAIKDKEAEIKGVQEEKQKSRASLDTTSRMKASDLHFRANLENFYDEKIAMLYKELRDLEDQKLKKMRELEEKNKELKIFEKLKEKHFEAFIEEENREERIALDEIATMNYSREE